MERVMTNIYLLSLLFYTSSSDYWSKWTSWSECSRTCDGGATHQLRNCIKSPYGPSCKGDSIRYATCHTSRCTAGVPDFRTEQCAAHNDIPYSGRSYRWRPYHNSSNPCALHCLAEETKWVKVLAPKVLDGTRCDDHSLDMCINGVCWPVGCDLVLNSTATVDSCGMCKGENLCRKPSRRYSWADGSFSECSVSCGVGTRESVHLCKDSYRGRTVDSSQCVNLIPPSTKRHRCKIRSCPPPPQWQVGKWEECTKSCGGGESWRMVRCVETLGAGAQMVANDSSCRDHKPSSRKSCNNEICPRWYAGEWSPCSVSCGAGMHYREVICRHVGDTYCDVQRKPITQKNCSTNISCYHRIDGRHDDDDDRGDIQEVSLGELRVETDTTTSEIHEEDLDKHDMTIPRFVVSDWSLCSATCGSGSRWRYVRCKVFLHFLGDITDLPDSECDETKPADVDTCFTDPCYDDYQWRKVGMTDCSRTCLGGVKETILECVHKSNNSMVSPDFCLEAPELPIERSICNDHPCPQKWRIGDFGTCSVTCGGGIMTRNVTCIQEFAPGPTGVLRLPDFMCEQPVPQRESPCNTGDCPATWYTGDWSECSVTCGVGYMGRPLYCQRVSSQSLITNVTMWDCPEFGRPDDNRPCNMSECPEAKIKTQSVRFFQLNKLRKIRLHVGMEAGVFPDTSIVGRCPSIGLNRAKLTWLKNGLTFRRGKRINVSKKGNLRIKRSKPRKDTGTYSCVIEGHTANFTLYFSTLYDISRENVLREQYLTDSSSDDLIDPSLLHRDPFDRKLRPLTLVKTNWTSCSVTCGGGLQTRNISCEIITKDYYEVFPVSICSNAGITDIETVQKCNTQACVHWKTGLWSECSITKCVRNYYSVQKRSVHCGLEANDTVLNDTVCFTTLGPPPANVTECRNTNCSTTWNTSDWSQCSAECGRMGNRTRIFNCIWSGTGQRAGRNCDLLRRPETVKPCKGMPCSEACKDESDYCSIVMHMKLCRYANFKEQCCSTCKKRKHKS